MQKLVLVFAGLILTSAITAVADTAGKPSSVELTIYNQDFALVREVREISLKKGTNYVAVPDVAASIQPETVAFKSLTDPGGVVVREQNYQYDVIEPNTILNKSVGKTIKVRRFIDGSVQEIEGILLNPASVKTNDQEKYLGVVIKTDKGVLLNPSGEIEVPELPEGLVSRPTLVWKLDASKDDTHRAEIAYITNDITWRADYVAVVDALDKHVDLTGWVTLVNNCGTTYENASLNLMAGDVHRIQREEAKQVAWGRGVMAEAMAPQFAEKAFFEYHLYTLTEKTTVRDKESKQLTLLSATEIPVKKVYVYDGRKAWWQTWRYYGTYYPGESYDVSASKKVAVFIETVNSKENNLGIPLPKGIVRVYKQEASANQHFIGEDEIDHTPKDEKIRLYLGDAFDIVGEHKRTGFRRISNTEVEETFEITLRNHKDTPVTVVVVEHLSGDWRIVNCSHKYYKKDASTLEIPVEVEKDGQAVVTYTARTKW